MCVEKIDRYIMVRCGGCIMDHDPLIHVCTLHCGRDCVCAEKIERQRDRVIDRELDR